MNWIKFSDRKPTEYKYYLVARKIPCDGCDKKIDHAHRMSYQGKDFDVCLWSKADLRLVEFYNAKGDNSWDWAGVDHWTENKHVYTEQITHWMDFNNELD